MPTTTNFGWTTPADTDLVKDGASAIRTLGNGIDTSLVDLKGGTTGQVLSKASNTDMDFTWVAQDDSNAIQNALLTTTGDTIYASSASTPARLGIGTTGQVLTVSGGVPAWTTISSGGMTLLSTTTLSGATTTISSISGSYNMLVGYVRLSLPATDTSGLRLRLNSNSSATYAKFASNSGNSTTQTFSSTEIDLAAGQDNAVTQAFCYFDIPDYANTTTWKMVRFHSAVNDGTTDTSIRNFAGYTIWNQTSAIDALQFFMSSGNLTSGTVLLYGVK